MPPAKPIKKVIPLTTPKAAAKVMNALTEPTIAPPPANRFAALLQLMKEFRWMEMRTAFHLQSDEAAGRLATLLAMHVLLDGALTAVLSRRFRDPGTSKSVEQVENIVGTINFGIRFNMVKAAGLISETCARQINDVNQTRNRVAHLKSKDLKEGDGIVPEIAFMKDFERCMDSGESALKELNRILEEPPATAQ